MAGGVEFLGRLKHGFSTQGSPGIVASEQGLEFTDDLLGSGFRDHVAFDFQLERLLEEGASLLASHALDGGIVSRAPVGLRDQSKEYVSIKVLEDADLQYYLLTDTTYTDDTHISNKLRHLYWFPTTAVVKGDYVWIYTGKGTNTSRANDAKTTTHILYWGLAESVWNNDGDCAVLFEIKAWKAKRS